MDIDLMVDYIRSSKPFFYSVNEDIGVENSIPRLITNRLNLELMLLHMIRLKDHVDSIYGIIGLGGEYELYYRVKRV